MEGDAALTRDIDAEGRPGRAAEQVIVFTVKAWDANCPQHIPQRLEAADVAKALESATPRIEALELEVARLRQSAGELKELSR